MSTIHKVWIVGFLFLDFLGIWLLLYPSGPVKLWTAGRAAISDKDRFIGRLVGALIIWTQFLMWAGSTTNRGIRITLEASLFVIFATAAVFLVFRITAPRMGKGSADSVGMERWRVAEVEPDADTKARYKAAWERLRRLRFLFGLLFLGWLPFAYLLFLVFRLLHWNENIAMILVLMWIPFMPVVAWKWSYWKCPRCGYAFKGKYSLFFPRHCNHCGLPIWADGPAAE